MWIRVFKLIFIRSSPTYYVYQLSREYSILAAAAAADFQYWNTEVLFSHWHPSFSENLVVGNGYRVRSHDDAGFTKYT